MHEYDVFLKAECNMDPLVWSLYRKNGFFHVRFKNFWMLSTVECVIWLWITMCISNLLVGSYNSELTVPDVHIKILLDGVFSLLAQCSPSKQCFFRSCWLPVVVKASFANRFVGQKIVFFCMTCIIVTKIGWKCKQSMYLLFDVAVETRKTLDLKVFLAYRFF